MNISKLLFTALFLIIMILSCSNGTQDSTPTKSEAPVRNATEIIMAHTPTSTSPNEDKKPQEDLSGNVQVITEDEFAKKITEFQSEKGFQYKGKTPCIVDFYADWCRPCTALNPTLVKLAEKYKGKLIIYKINVDKAQRVAGAFQIKSIPTLVFFKPNEQPGMMVGAPTEEELDNFIQNEFLQ